MTRERPILFSDEMVRALLDGRKTQTRRVVKPQPLTDGARYYADAYNKTERWAFWRCDDNRMSEPRTWRCPQGVGGDRLWVREAWAPFYAPGAALAYPQPDMHEANAIRYRATPDQVRAYPTSLASWLTRPSSREHVWRPSIFMPRWASRITLEIVDVRVQRLHDISEEDAHAEGCRPRRFCAEPNGETTARREYEWLWERINGEGSWASNPWVWAVSFKRIDGERAEAA